MCENPWPCHNPQPHEGGPTGHGCIHHGTGGPPSNRHEDDGGDS